MRLTSLIAGKFRNWLNLLACSSFIACSLRSIQTRSVLTFTKWPERFWVSTLLTHKCVSAFSWVPDDYGYAELLEGSCVLCASASNILCITWCILSLKLPLPSVVVMWTVVGTGLISAALSSMLWAYCPPKSSLFWFCAVYMLSLWILFIEDASLCETVQFHRDSPPITGPTTIHIITTQRRDNSGANTERVMHIAFEDHAI